MVSALSPEAGAGAGGGVWGEGSGKGIADGSNGFYASKSDLVGQGQTSLRGDMGPDKWCVWLCPAQSWPPVWGGPPVRAVRPSVRVRVARINKAMGRTMLFANGYETVGSWGPSALSLTGCPWRLGNIRDM